MKKQTSRYAKKSLKITVHKMDENYYSNLSIVIRIGLQLLHHATDALELNRSIWASNDMYSYHVRLSILPIEFLYGSHVPQLNELNLWWEHTHTHTPTNTCTNQPSKRKSIFYGPMIWNLSSLICNKQFLFQSENSANADRLIVVYPTFWYKFIAYIHIIHTERMSGYIVYSVVLYAMRL